MVGSYDFNCRHTTCFDHQSHHRASTTKIFREKYTSVTRELYYERKLFLLHRKVKFLQSSKIPDVIYPKITAAQIKNM